MTYIEQGDTVLLELHRDQFASLVLLLGDLAHQSDPVMADGILRFVDGMNHPRGGPFHRESHEVIGG